MRYTKPPLTTDQHIELLQERGLTIEDPERARKYLNTIGYFRLTGYMYHLQSKDGHHRFQGDTSFNDILLHYKFDKALRRLFNEYLERIEVALRAKLNQTYSLMHGFYWYTDRELYAEQQTYDTINEEIRKSFAEAQERFLRAFKAKYTDEDLPPSNMALETLSFGKLVRLFNGLNNANNEKTEVARFFGIPNTLLVSWLIRLSIVRNICAHHSRLWNRLITAQKPKIPSRKKYRFEGAVPENFSTSLYGTAALLDRILGSINPENRFTMHLTVLIDEYPLINTDLMGFPKNWREEAVWLTS